MTKTLKIASVFVLGLALSLVASAQTYISNTTLSAAVTTTSTTQIALTSATGVTATNTLLFVDNEGMFVNSVAGNTVYVTRGYYGGRATTHASGALVWFGPPPAFGWAWPGGYPSGSCTRGNQQYLPYINTNDGAISDCVGGVWVTGGSSTGSNGTFTTVQLPAPGAVAWSSVGTSTAIASATSMYCTEIDVQASKLITGLAPLNGATAGGTDKHIAILYDGTGNVLANSATGGTATSGTNAFQKLNFTSPGKYYLVGPAKYYACLQSNGTTDTERMLTTGTQDQTTTKAVTGQTFGTIASTFTVPTTFTTVVGPYWELY